MKKQTISIMSLSGIAALLYSLSFFIFFIASLFVESVNGISSISVLNNNIINTLVCNRWLFGISFIFLGYFGGILIALEIKLIKNSKSIKILVIVSLLIGLICGIIGLHILRTIF
ncbi:MAG: hypothetical protein GY707_04135 [Desulfobacteraceae bacterium]|nr:hypothetical protein [Desulfobacteraceae bacterium]